MIPYAPKIGVPRTRDYNGPDQFGAFYYQTTVGDGRRCSTAQAFLHPAMSRPNLRVLTGAECRRVLFEGTRAVGIEIERKGAIETIRAGREVILAAGAYHSPKLLMLSGLGPADHLRAHQAVPEQVESVSIDMSPAFIAGVTQHLPNARVTFDKFHVIGHASMAVAACSTICERANSLLALA